MAGISRPERRALHTDDGQHYGVIVPDLPSCFSAGSTLDEAVEMVREAIDLHAETLAQEGHAPSAPRSLAEHQADPELSGAVWAHVDVPVERYFGLAKKINITVPARVLARIDEYARRHGESRSGFLVRADQLAISA